MGGGPSPLKSHPPMAYGILMRRFFLFFIFFCSVILCSSIGLRRNFLHVERFCVLALASGSFFLSNKRLFNVIIKFVVVVW